MPSRMLQRPVGAGHWSGVTGVGRLLGDCVDGRLLGDCGDDLVGQSGDPDLKSCPGKALPVFLTFGCQDSDFDMSVEDFTLKT